MQWHRSIATTWLDSRHLTVDLIGSLDTVIQAV